MVDREATMVHVESVGDEAVNEEDHTTICGGEEPAYRRSKAKYAQREREAQRTCLIHRLQLLQPPLQKVTKSLYIVNTGSFETGNMSHFKNSPSKNDTK